MNVGIVIDGAGLITVTFLKGRLRAIHLDIGPNAPIRIEQATETVFRAGQCRNKWFRTDVDVAQGNEFLAVEVACPPDASMNFMPDGLSQVHVGPGTTRILTYSQDQGFRVRGKHWGRPRQPTPVAEAPEQGAPVAWAEQAVLPA